MAGEAILLDTNVLIAYVREGRLAEAIERRLRLQSGRAEGLVSVISIGESLAFARKNQWTAARQEKLRSLVRTRLAPIDINRVEILDAYADIYDFLHRVRKPAHPIGENDMWIAATARASGAMLVTMDRHFDHLHPDYIKRLWIDPKDGAPDAH